MICQTTDVFLLQYKFCFFIFVLYICAGFAQILVIYCSVLHLLVVLLHFMRFLSKIYSFPVGAAPDQTSVAEMFFISFSSIFCHILTIFHTYIYL